MSGRAMPLRRAIELAAQIADALAEGHAQGFVHGDLRPETVVVTPKGSTKILNFGMATWTAGGLARAKAAEILDVAGWRRRAGRRLSFTRAGARGLD